MNKRSYREVTQMELHIVADLKALGRLAADQFVMRAVTSIQNTGRFTVALSGGETPKELFIQLTADRASELDWSKVHFFWGDERHVGPMDKDSNYRLAKQYLLDPLQVPDANIHRIRGEDPVQSAARTYEDDLRQFFDPAPGTWPRFDLILLGLGEDGHTASLFPGSAALRDRVHLVAGNVVPQIATERVTFTYPVINAAAYVLVLVSGVRKSSMVQTVLENPPDPEKLPMQGVQPKDGQLIWLLDASAASILQAGASKPFT
ncbi:6-phosphogluconolactonase [Oligoflexus tunisiensis]|uniref:6-phosphogluconolactonase n=1 Tax=Oligoflexus tunisiensis TaxID=708132 RepID=UPI000A53E201|nr:6-phosphogluconolactonase [Oligoflexus tunisiensis]